MPFLAGETITAGRLNRLRPKVYFATATGSVPASSVGVDVPGLSVTFTTETANAEVDIFWSTAFYSGTTAPTTNGSARAFVDATGAPHYTISDTRVANAKETPAQTWQTTIPAAGSHTVKVVATTPANMTTAGYSALRVTVYEFV